MGHKGTHFSYLPTHCKTLCLTPLYVTYRSADNLTCIELLDLRFQLAKVPDQRTHALWQRMYSVDQVTKRNAP